MTNLAFLCEPGTGVFGIGLINTPTEVILTNSYWNEDKKEA